MEDGVFFEATQAEPLEGQGQTRAERRDQQIQRILEAAQTCFVRSGFQGASMQQICAECGMSPGALYRYFPSKEAIVAAICEADREDDMTCFGALRDATSAVDGLVDGAMAHITHTHNKGSAALFAEMRSESNRNATIRETVDSHKQEIAGMIAPLVTGRDRARRNRSACRFADTHGRPHVGRRRHRDQRPAVARHTARPDRGSHARHACRHAEADDKRTAEKA